MTLLAPTRDDLLLDVGTGTGAFLAELARAPQRPDGAVGIDLSRQMLQRAPPLPQGWRLLQADARSLPFTDATFDAISAAYLLHLLCEQDREVVISEAARILRPGGRIVTVTPSLGSGRRSESLSVILRRITRDASGTLRGLRPCNPGPELSRHGFTITAVKHVRLGYPSLCVAARL